MVIGGGISGADASSSAITIGVPQVTGGMVVEGGSGVTALDLSGGTQGGLVINGGSSVDLTGGANVVSIGGTSAGV